MRSVLLPPLLLVLAACEGGREPAEAPLGGASSPPRAESLERLPDLAAQEVPRSGPYKLRDRDRHPVGRRLAYLLLKASPFPSVPYGEIRRRLVGDVGGVSFGHLKALFDALGVPSRAAFLPLPEALQRLPAILAVAPRLKPVVPEDVAFLLARKVRADGQVEVTDPVTGAAVAAPAELAARYKDAAFFLEGKAPPAVDAPDLGLVEVVWSWGRVDAGTLVRHAFRIWNRGGKPLTVLAVEPSCGCVAAPVTKGAEPAPPPKGAVRRHPRTGRWEVHFPRTFQPLHLAPGEAAWVTAYYDTTNRSGRLPVNLTLVTDDPDEPRVTLAMDGLVDPLFEVDPPYGLALGTLTAGQEARGVFWLRSVKGKPFRILAVTTTHPAVCAAPDPKAPREAPDPETLPPTVKPRAHPAGAGWQAVRVEVTGKVKPGPLSAMVDVRTDLGPVPLSYGVWARVVGNLEVPAAVDFGRVPMGRAAVRTFRVRSRAGRLRLKRIRVSRPQLFTAAFTAVGPGEYQVEVRLRAGWMAPVLRGTLLLETDDPLEPTRTLEVRGFVARPTPR